MSKERKNKESLDSGSHEVEDISKIRDILFGNNMNEYEKRFDLLEKKLAHSISENKEETEKKILSLENYLRKEFKLLNDRLQEEEDSRMKSDKKIIMEIESLEEGLKKFKQTTSDNFSEEHQQMHELSNSLNNKISELSKSLQERMESYANQLQNNKVERSSFAMLLTDLAYKIAGEQDSDQE
jgi:exonuclease VII large subunit